MLLTSKVNICRILKPQNLGKYTKYSTNSLVKVDNDEYTKEPQYPPIEERSFHHNLYKRRQKMYENLKNLGTVEEKIFALNMSKYYGHKCAMLYDNSFPYNCLSLIQHATRTVFHADMPVPISQKQDPEQFESFFRSLKSDIEDAIAFEFTGYKPDINRIYDPELSPLEKSRQRSAKLVNHINRVLLNALTPDNAHLSEAEIDIDPRHEAFWFAGGMEPPTNVQKYRAGLSYLKDRKHDPVNRAFQYIGQPFLTLRHKLPLKSLETNSAKDLPKFVPTYKWDPRTNNFNTDYRPGVTVPGFWPGSANEFGLLSYHSRNHISFRKQAFGQQDHQEALHAQAILCSYGWIYGQACYQGFSTFNDLTYPLTTQTIITDGQMWSFYVYQLNTTGIHIDVFDTNPMANECWGTKDLKLFEAIDEHGKLIGFNDDVLKYLIQFYTNAPVDRHIDMKPYLNKVESKIADIQDEPKRVFLEKTYKHLMSNRPRHRLVPEVYNWEKIYKIDNNTRPLDRKLRFFELGINPWQRRLDDHTPNYIPKALREDRKKKWETLYYPKI